MVLVVYVEQVVRAGQLHLRTVSSVNRMTNDEIFEDFFHKYYPEHVLPNVFLLSSCENLQ